MSDGITEARSGIPPFSTRKSKDCYERVWVVFNRAQVIEAICISKNTEARTDTGSTRVMSYRCLHGQDQCDYFIRDVYSTREEAYSRLAEYVRQDLEEAEVELGKAKRRYEVVARRAGLIQLLGRNSDD